MNLWEKPVKKKKDANYGTNYYQYIAINSIAADKVFYGDITSSSFIICVCLDTTDKNHDTRD